TNCRWRCSTRKGSVRLLTFINKRVTGKVARMLKAKRSRTKRKFSFSRWPSKGIKTFTYLKWTKKKKVKQYSRCVHTNFLRPNRSASGYGAQEFPSQIAKWQADHRDQGRSRVGA